MDQRLNVPAKKSAKPSKSLALAALCIAIALSYFLVKTYRTQQKNNYTHLTLSLPKVLQQNSTPTQGPKETEWRTIKTRAGDSLASVFKRAGLSRQTLQLVLHRNQHVRNLSKIRPNQEIQIHLIKQQLQELIMPLSATQYITVQRKNGRYATQIHLYKTQNHDQYLTATVRGSLYGTAKKMGIPRKLIQQMTDIFNWEIDFSKEVQTGDQFSIVYQASYREDKLVGTGDIIAVTYTHRGKTHRAIRHVNSAGDYTYYTPEGGSLKKAFSRYPLKFSHISSTFSLARRHPILHYKRPHRGIDLAAPIGTPIRATGDGRIEIIDRQNGYGNMIKLAHDKTYTSIYGHLLKFQKGLAKGDRVKRGQIIGYVGQTGLATGPHCHYEFHINHHPKNPTTVALPHGAPVPKHLASAFKTNAKTILARLKLFEEANLASSGKKHLDNA